MKLFKKIVFILFALMGQVLVDSTFSILLPMAQLPGQMPFDMGDMNNMMPSDLSDAEREELKKFANQLIDTLDPELSPEKKAELVNKTVQDTVQMDSYLKNLPENERIAKEKEIEDAVSYLTGPESPMKELFEEPVKQEALPEVKDIKEEKVIPAKEEPKVVISKDVEEIKIVLEKLIERINSLSIKVTSMKARISPATSEKWSELHPSLMLLESTLKAIIKKNNLLKALTTSEEFKNLKNKLIKLESNLTKNEVKFKVPDTAGLAIIFDTEDEDNVEFLTSEKQLNGIIASLKDNVTKDIFSDFKDLIDKNAPEVLKDNPELNKGFEKFEAPQQNGAGFPGNFNRFRPGGYPGSDYYPTNYGPSFEPQRFDGQVPANVDNLASQPSDASKKTDKSGAAGKKSDKDDKEKGSGKKDGKSGKAEGDDKKSSESDSKTLKDNPLFEKHLNEFNSSLDSIAKSLSKTDIPSVIDQIKEIEKSKKINKAQELNIRDFPMNLDEIEKKFDKTIKTSNRLSAFVKLQKKTVIPELNKLIQKAYYNSKFGLESHYDYIKLANDLLSGLKKQKNIIITNWPKYSEDVNTKIDSILKKQDQIRKIFDLKRLDEKQFNNLNSSLLTFSTSLHKADIPLVLNKINSQIQVQQITKANAIDNNDFNNKISILRNNFNNIKKILNKLVSDINLHQGAQEIYVAKLKKIYEDPKINISQSFNNIQKLLAVIKNKNLTQSNQEIYDAVNLLLLDFSKEIQDSLLNLGKSKKG